MADYYFVGHHRSWSRPEAVILQEDYHKNKFWVSVIKYRDYYTVAIRTNKHKSEVRGIDEAIFETVQEAKNFADKVLAADYKSPFYQAENIRDSQVSRVYKFDSVLYGILCEAHKANHLVLSNDGIKKILDQLSAFFGVKVPRLRFRKMVCSGHYRFGEITLSRQDPVTVIHEFAHHVIALRHLHGSRVASHGPEFVRAYLQAVEHITKIPMKNLEDVCDKLGVKYAPLDEMKLAA